MRVLKNVGLLMALTAALAACGGDEGGSDAGATQATSSEELTEVTVARAPALPQLPYFVAEAEGIFEEHGLAVDYAPVQSGPEQAAAMIAGDLDITTNVPNNLFGLVAGGADMVMFGKEYTASQFDLVIASDYQLSDPDAGWEQVMADLEGARIGVVARGAAAEDIARTLFEEAGVNPDAATYIATGLPATTLASFEADQIDAAVTLEPGISIGLEQGLFSAPFSIRAGDGPESLRWPGLVSTTTVEFADANPDVLVSYLAGMQAANAFIHDEANRDVVIGIMSSELSMEQTAAEAYYDEWLELYPTDVSLTEDDLAALETAAEWTMAVGATESVVDVQSIVVQPGS